MGYRHYLYKIEKEVVENVKDKTFSELWDKYATQSDREWREKYPEDNYLDIDRIPKECIFEFGKLYWDDTAARIYATGKPLFNNKEVQEQFDDFRPYVVTKEALLVAIEIYKKKVIESYEDCFVENTHLCDPFFRIPIEEVPKSIQEKCIEHVQEKLLEWKRGYTIDTDLDDKNHITSSWYYEYSIFNLIHLYKTIDFDKYDLLFYGW